MKVWFKNSSNASAAVVDCVAAAAVVAAAVVTQFQVNQSSKLKDPLLFNSPFTSPHLNDRTLKMVPFQQTRDSYNKAMSHENC